MAYIQPDATILICQNVPLNASYDDTITFYNDAGEWDYQAQYNYFAGKTTTAMTKEKYSVVRERQGILRVEGDVSHWQKVNYMVFTNKNFGGKHFYAFINKAEYVNPNTTFLHFQIDVLQTWLGDLKFEACYIDREHVEDDSLYANRESEGIEVQERLGYDTPFNFEPFIGQRMLVIGSTENPLDVLHTPSNRTVKFNLRYSDLKFYGLNIIDYDVVNITPDTPLQEGESIVFNKEGNIKDWYFTVPSTLPSFTFQCVRTLYLFGKDETIKYNYYEKVFTFQATSDGVKYDFTLLS